MKKLVVSFEGVTDTTGYLFTFAKCIAASLQCSEYEELAEDVIAASGFAFRMWVDGKCLCPSAMSIWEFAKQKEWMENAGLSCCYVERMWGQDDLEEVRRKEAIALICESIDKGTAAVAWDVGDCEWDLIIGYDETAEVLCVLRTDGKEDTVPFAKLGQFEIPILSVLTFNGKADKIKEALVNDTRKLALSHLQGEEWCDNAKGYEAYDALIAFMEHQISEETVWNLEYYLGNYAALKWYAWQFWKKYDEKKLEEVYRKIYTNWQDAFEIVRAGSCLQEANKKRVISFLRTAQEAEAEAMKIL